MRPLPRAGEVEGRNNIRRDSKSRAPRNIGRQATVKVPGTLAAATHEAHWTIDSDNDDLGVADPRAGRGQAEAVHLVEHMTQALDAARASGLEVFVVPHRRYQPGDWEGAQFLPYRQTLPAITKAQLFARGSWGGEFRAEFKPKPADVVASEHWVSSGFANPDLDMLLKQHGVDHSVLMGMRANSLHRVHTQRRRGTWLPHDGHQ